uniref:hAT-like transposase RNase-H fold domain-containing protein n=1 Tax=Brassica oleracea TaxID=3712 RepID=A0A3P6AIP1_BRAOL|nr:unnamed protein product [Brassica oleracea]
MVFKKKTRKEEKSSSSSFFDKYRKEYSDILSTVAVLDPKLKFAVLEYCYDTLDPLTSKSKVDHILKSRSYPKEDKKVVWSL